MHGYRPSLSLVWTGSPRVRTAPLLQTPSPGPDYAMVRPRSAPVLTLSLIPNPDSTSDIPGGDLISFLFVVTISINLGKWISECWSFRLGCRDFYALTRVGAGVSNIQITEAGSPSSIIKG